MSHVLYTPIRQMLTRRDLLQLGAATAALGVVSPRVLAQQSRQAE